MMAETTTNLAGERRRRAEGERRTSGVLKIRKDHGTPYPEAFGVNLRNSSPAAFTIIEMLVVLIIILVLAALTVGAAKHAQTMAAISRTRSEIAAMEMALEHFKSDNGRYPSSTGTRATFSGYPSTIEIYNSGSLYTALAGGSKIYYNFRADQIHVNGGSISPAVTNVIDPFGNPYNYYCPPAPATGLVWSNQATFDLWSYGPNGFNDEGTNDDITNWKRN